MGPAVVTVRLKSLGNLLPLLLIVALVGAVVVMRTSGSTPASGSAGHAARHLALDAKKKTGVAAYVPPIHHVFVINIENEDESNTWGDDNGNGSPAPYLAKTLRKKGVLLNSYYGIGHNSLDNYIAQVSGQGPNPDTQLDCQVYANFESTGTTSLGQVEGVNGCVYPKSVKTVVDQMRAKKLSWKGYMDDMKTPCEHPTLGTQDKTQTATATAEYATRHDPFMYFHSIIDDKAYCAAHVVRLSRMVHDLKKVRTTPNLSYITPDLCDDGHDSPCADGRPGGLKSVNTWMKKWVPRILRSKAYKLDGVLIITADESDGPTSDSGSCCGETAVNTPLAGILGSGGGVIGALVISRFTRPDTWSDTPYNHYALLASLEEIFRLPKLGYAAAPGLDRFGLDVYNSGWNLRRAKP